MIRENLSDLGELLPLIAICVLFCLPLLSSGKVSRPGISARIKGRIMILFVRVTSAASVDHIGIVASQNWLSGLRLKVFHTEGRITRGTPRFAPQTVNAAKGEFIAKPRFERAIIVVTSRPVTALVSVLRIVEHAALSSGCGRAGVRDNALDGFSHGRHIAQQL